MRFLIAFCRAGSPHPAEKGFLRRDQVFFHRVAGEYGGVTVCFIGKDQFIANKRARGRAKDMADIEALGE